MLEALLYLIRDAHPFSIMPLPHSVLELRAPVGNSIDTEKTRVMVVGVEGHE